MSEKISYFFVRVYIILFILGFSGVMLIYSSRTDSNFGFEAADFALKQFFFLLVGFICMDFMRKVDWRKLLDMSAVLFYIALLMLWGVLVFGVKINGMKGWYSLNYVYLQPSEILRFIFILHVSDIFLKEENKEKAFLKGGLISLLWIAAILLQPDFGTALIYGLIFAVISFLAGVKWYVLLLLPLGAVTGLFTFIGRKEYGFKRLYGFFSENADVLGEAWHWKQFQLTIARGGWFGNKIDGAFWSNHYLPFAYNDSAYAALHELLGYVGASLILLLFFYLFYLFFKRSRVIGDERLVVRAGISAVLMHVLLHCSVNCAIVPTTGVTMPLISYGGSSLLGMFLIFGMLLSFCRAATGGDENNSCSC